MPGNGGAAMFSFGYGFGAILMAITAFQHEHSKVTPVCWKKALAVPKNKDSARARASELMPLCSDIWKLKKHDGRAEAAMIAFWWAKTNVRYPESIRLRYEL